MGNTGSRQCAIDGEQTASAIAAIAQFVMLERKRQALGGVADAAARLRGFSSGVNKRSSRAASRR